MSAFSVHGKQAVVVGAARSGVAAAQLLVARGARVTLTDLREHIDQEGALRKLGMELELGRHEPDTFREADLVVVSPGVPLGQPSLDAARDAGVPVVSEVELASRWVRGRIVAVTGTKGKSTTTSLVGRMLRTAGYDAPVGGNIGTPLSSQVAASTAETIHVVEVSSFQLETTQTFHPWIAVLVNFSPDHLDRHRSVEEYAEAKARIFANQEPRDWAVLNADDPPSLKLAARTPARIRRFAMSGRLEEGITVVGDAIVRKKRHGTERVMPTSAVRLIGPHLMADVLAAVAACDLIGASDEAMTEAVSLFAGLEHAMELAGEVAGVRFVNDSKATNIEAARRAVETFDRGLVVIMGGRFKGGDFSLLREPLRARAKTVIAIGEAAPLIHDGVGGVVPVIDATSMHDAVRAAFGAAAPGATVLLAPACASFDMFADYAERGRIFKQEVERLAQEMGGTREQ